MAQKKSGLGSNPLNPGLDWIGKKNLDSPEIKKENTQYPSFQESVSPDIIDGKTVQMVPITSIIPDKNQPRKDIDIEDSSIKELAESIKKYGFINFISVRKEKEDKYMIVAGERRFHAAEIAGLKEIPVMIISPDKPALDYALIQIEENIQRQDLSTFEEVEFYDRLHKEFGLEQKDIAERTGRSKSYISKMVKLTNISPELKKEVDEKTIPREILFDLADFSEEDQKKLWKKIKDTPSIVAFEKAKEKFVIPRKERQFDPNRPDPDTVFDALKRAMKMDKDNLFEFITPKKIEKLLQEYGIGKE